MAHALVAQIQVTVFEAQILVDLFFFVDHEGRRFGRVQDVDGLGLDLDLAGRQVGILGAVRTPAHHAGDLHHPFIAQLGSFLGHLGVLSGVGDHLDDAEAVAEIDEGDPAVVAVAVHPARQGHGLTAMGGAELTAGMGFIHSGLQMNKISVGMIAYEF